MGYFDPGPPRKEYSGKVLFQLFELLKTAINNIDTNNFPSGISGSIIKDGTLSGSAVIDRSLDMGALKWLEWPIPLVLPADVAITTLTAGKNLGGYFLWNPNNFPGGDWYLEASIAISNASGTATCTLTGAADVGSVTTQETSLTRVRSGKLTMPVTGQNLWVVLKTSNASYTASLGGARLIFVPT